MTLAAPLEELKGVDADTEFDISEWCGQLQTIPTCDLGQALIQNSIQRACERRGWGYTISNLCNSGQVICRIDVNENKSVEYADSPAKALLAAYIAAVSVSQ